MLLVNACGGTDVDEELIGPDAADGGRRDASSDSAARGDATDAARSDATDARVDAPRDALSADAARADADARVDVGIDSGRDAAADAGRDADAAVPTLDTGSPALDARADARPDATLTTPEAAAPEAAAPEAATPEAATPEAATPTVDAGPAVDAAAADAVANDATDSGAPATSADAATTLQYSFENGVQGWTNVTGDPGGPPSSIGSVATTTAQHDTGASSLAVTFSGVSTEDTQLALLSVDMPAGLAPGKVVTVRMFIPENTLAWFDIYDMDTSESGHWADSFFTPEEAEPHTIHAGVWWTYTHAIPTTTLPTDEEDASVPRVGPTQRFGFKFGALGPGTIYIDSITW